MADQALVNRRLQLLFGFYAVQGKPSPELARGLLEILTRYSPEIVIAATSATGVAQECRFLPTIAEMVDWCERAMQPERERAVKLKREQDMRRDASRSDRDVSPQARQRADEIVRSAIQSAAMSPYEILRRPEFRPGDRLDVAGAARWAAACAAGADPEEARAAALGLRRP